MAKRAIFMCVESTGIAEFGEALSSDFGFELLGNALAASVLAKRGVACQELSPSAAIELLEDPAGRVELVAVNFADPALAGRACLSWKAALAGFDRDLAELLRRAAWKLERVAALGLPAHYEAAIGDLRANGGELSHDFRLEMAVGALRAVSEFEFSVADYLEVQAASRPDLAALSGYGKAARFAWPRAQALAAGENAHQKAALYGSFWEHFRQVSGKGALDYQGALELSFAAQLIGEFEKPTCIVTRMGRVSAARSGDTIDSALRGLFDCVQPRGCFVVANGGLEASELAWMAQRGVAGVLAPRFSRCEVDALKEHPAVRAFAPLEGLGYGALREMRSVAGGALIQDKDRVAFNPMEWTVESLVQPELEDWESLLFAAKLARHAQSASVVFARAESSLEISAAHADGDAAFKAVSGDCDLRDSVAVFDLPCVSGAALRAIKARGARCVLLPSGENVQEQREAAAESGLCLLAMRRTLRRL